ncbi:hypothetical protein SNOG_03197 [Parastagonospora nodorum SN15]|uniref:Uncharacterized protein n=1 Tax=Phaeosphaeria nodorum (strain SN15 / ATCC MYA-4574 / FGSC 10173) TaxID=321614 RepID=Q0UYG7_PHANO|nr:hypothetical protein SNOG_03197 [Parastagonospora nodorum SN15]EAT89928.1 hypothetical protein SNOG_03197 [Parastagonospora nodorum SN15]
MVRVGSGNAHRLQKSTTLMATLLAVVPRQAVAVPVKPTCHAGALQAASGIPLHLQLHTQQQLPQYRLLQLTMYQPAAVISVEAAAETQTKNASSLEETILDAPAA